MRRRMSRGSLLVQTAHEHARAGTPALVPVPRKVKRIEDVMARAMPAPPRGRARNQVLLEVLAGDSSGSR